MKVLKEKWLNVYDDKDLDLIVSVEVEEGTKKFGSFNSSHELYAVLKEELDEFWDSVKKNDPDPRELVQIIAVARRGLVEMCEWARNKRVDNEKV